MIEQWLNHPHAAPWLVVMWIAGLLGSLGHCAGMCGPIVAAFGLSQARQGGRMWTRHLRFQMGRISTYTILGALIGFLGGFARLGQVARDCLEDLRHRDQALVADVLVHHHPPTIFCV